LPQIDKLEESPYNKKSITGVVRKSTREIPCSHINRIREGENYFSKRSMPGFLWKLIHF